MATSNSQSLPFLYISGDPALDLVNTVDWTEHGPVNDRLPHFDRLTRWAEEAGLIDHETAAGLRSGGSTHPKEAQSAHRSAMRARSVLKELFSAIARGEAIVDQLADFNRLLGPSLERLQVVQVGERDRSLRFGWEKLGESLESILWPVLWSAASLLVSAEVGQIRICGGKDCGWMYVDRSRNRLRRWCQMETCGTREKTRRRYLRAGRR
jgi:predicted RNA-binding Zn ribbon-like protein